MGCLSQTLFNYLQGRRGVGRDGLGRNVDRTAIDSFRAERSDSRDCGIVSCERLRHDRQAEAVLSIIRARTDARSSEMQQCRFLEQAAPYCRGTLDAEETPAFPRVARCVMIVSPGRSPAEIIVILVWRQARTCLSVHAFFRPSPIPNSRFCSPSISRRIDSKREF
jgi:hypothetical protein